MKEYLKKAECLRRRIQRKTNEIYLLHQQAEGMNGSGISNMLRTVSPDHSKMEGTVSKSWHWSRTSRIHSRSTMPRLPTWNAASRRLTTPTTVTF